MACFTAVAITFTIPEDVDILKYVAAVVLTQNQVKLFRVSFNAEYRIQCDCSALVKILKAFEQLRKRHILTGR